MFISYEYISHLGFDEKTKQYSYRYKIIDSDFEAEGVAYGFAVALGAEIVNAVIQEYSKRNLNIAANLIKAIKYHNKQCGYSVNTIIEYNKKHNSEFSKYEKELEKYLLLI